MDKDEMIEFLNQLENREYELKGDHPTLAEKRMFASIRVVIKESMRE